MLKFSPILTMVALSFAMAAVARADTSPTPVPDQKTDMSSMAFYLGTWSCQSTLRGSSRPNTTTYTMDYDGRWLRGHDVAPPFDKYRTRAIVSDSWLGYNAQAHQWVAIYVSDFGNYSVATSPGWNGNAITFTTAMTDDDSTGSDTLTKVSDTQTSDVATGKNKDGSAQPTQTTTCKKA